MRCRCEYLIEDRVKIQCLTTSLVGKAPLNYLAFLTKRQQLRDNKTGIVLDVESERQWNTGGDCTGCATKSHQLQCLSIVLHTIVLYKGGFTGLIAALPALLIKWTPQKIKRAFGQVSSKDAGSWVQENLDPTVATNRRQTYAEMK